MKLFKHQFRLLVLSIWLLNFTGCGNAKKSNSGVSITPMGQWEVVQLRINDKITPPLEDGEQLIITFDQQEEGLRYGVKALVNAYGGVCKWKEDNIEILPGMGTLAMQTAFENAFFEVFQGTGSYDIRAEELYLYMKQGIIRAKRVEE